MRVCVPMHIVRVRLQGMKGGGEGANPLDIVRREARRKGMKEDERGGKGANDALDRMRSKG